MAGIRPVQMAMSLASINITFMKWICKCWIIELLNQIQTTAVAICDFLTPLSAMIAMLLDEEEEEEEKE